MTVTSKSTKAELLAALNDAEAELDLLRDAYYTAQPITTAQLRLAFNTIRRELVAVCEDVYNAGAFCRKASQPVLDALGALYYNSRVTVNN